LATEIFFNGLLGEGFHIDKWSQLAVDMHDLRSVPCSLIMAE